MPFGGVGYSGIGHYYGKDGFDALTHAKSILVSPPDVAIEHLFPPYTPEKVQELGLRLPAGFKIRHSQRFESRMRRHNC
jgi:hypothetical protein